MGQIKGGTKVFRAKTATEWRKWLHENHSKEKAIWLIIYHQDSGLRSLSYNEAVSEALCFGWIDSKPNKRDTHSYYLFFAKRKASSNWSKANRERAEQMIKEGRMTEAGKAIIDAAKKSGRWTALVNVQRGVIPEDLMTELKKDKRALTNFNAFPPSSKRIILEWILNAKKPETREKRIRETVTLASRNIRANHYRQ